LSGQNVGVIWGTTAEKNMLNLVPTANIMGFKSYKDAYNALKNGKINAITSDDTILSGYALDDNEVKLLPKRYSREPYGIGFKKGKTTIKLKENLDFAIEDMKQKNIINRIHKTWLD
jgi:ABC-type amino acid transport substrate-binding protein